MEYVAIKFDMIGSRKLRKTEVEFRCGVGMGTLSTTLQESSIGMDGVAWQHAKHAIDAAKRKRQFITFYGFDADLQVHLNAPAGQRSKPQLSFYYLSCTRKKTLLPC